MTIQGGQTFNSHAVALMGYQKYNNVVKFGLISIVQDKYFYLLADGWNTSPMYFDPNTSADPTLDFVTLKEY